MNAPRSDSNNIPGIGDVGKDGLDLSLLRTMTDEERVKVRKLARNRFQQAGLLCPCGELIREDGITVFLYREAMMPTERGAEPGFTLINAHFHSRDCLELEHMFDALESNKDDPGVFSPFCIKENPVTEWIGDVSFLNADSGD